VTNGGSGRAGAGTGTGAAGVARIQWGDRAHQYEQVTWSSKREKAKVVWCRSCRTELPNKKWIRYRCVVCKNDKWVLCRKCHKRTIRKRVGKEGLPFYVWGCRGNESLEDAISEEEEMALLNQMQLNDNSDLALDRIPKYFVPSVKGIITIVLL